MSPQPESSLSKQLEPGLYIVATPIGNLGDITLRAIDILNRCDRVACEDTRITGKLLKHLGIAKPLIRFDDHASDESRARLVAALQNEAVALVSDAGTPLVSDPGYRLLQDAHSAGVAITSLPGPSAPVMALTLSGLPNDRFMFAGFLPPKANARLDLLNELRHVRTTLIFFETAPRLLKSLETISEAYPDRQIAVARELTKLHEECRKGTASELAAHYQSHPPKGEIVLLVGPPAEGLAAGDPDELLREALETLKPSQAAAQVAKLTGVDRKALYARALELRSE